MDDLIWWLRLLGTPGIGPVLFGELILRFQTPERALRAPIEALLSVPRMDRKTALAISNRPDDGKAEAQLQTAAASQTTLLTLADERYPSLLKEIPAPPPILFVRGRPELLGEAGVAVVGARQATPYGKQAARVLARDLAGLGVTVVSGMARGIDSTSHRAALEKGG